MTIPAPVTDSIVNSTSSDLNSPQSIHPVLYHLPSSILPFIVLLIISLVVISLFIYAHISRRRSGVNAVPV